MLQLTFSRVILNLYYKFLKVEKLDQTVRHTCVCACMCILKIAFHRDSIQFYPMYESAHLPIYWPMCFDL